ncbi:MAG: hypothetical protein HZB67_02530 [Candidatus Aenigmarchaeota archaeon]|nr:hypothetical protein [Candidatus Aenigmarchaeota archaeon]
MLVKILGIMDIIAAFLLLFWVGAPFIVKVVFIIVLLVKGTTSLLADLVGKLYGIVDLATGIILLFAIQIPIVIAILLAGVLAFKGLFSLP